MGENNPTFSLDEEVGIQYGDKNQGANDWTNPKVDPVTGEATITVGKGAKGGDLAYVPVKVTNSDGSSFTIRATFTSKQPAPVALQPAFKAGPVGETLEATPQYTKNGEPYIDPKTVRIVGTDEKSDGKTLTVDGQGTWRVDAKTGEFFFTPVAGFVGDPTPIQYTANGVNGAEPVGPALVSVFYYPLETREATTYGPIEATQNSTDNNSPGDSGRTTAELFPKLPSDWYGQDNSPVTFQLVDPNGTPVQQGQALEIPNVGTYTIDVKTGVVSFKAAENFLGANETEKDAAKVGIRTVGLTNAERGGEDAQLTAYYRPTVEKQSFALPNARENGQTGQPQSATPNYRAFSTNPKTVKMVPVAGNTLSEDGKTMDVPDQGTWTVDDNGVFTFTPVTGFVGSPAPVRYEADSRSGQKAEGTGQVAIFYPDPRTLPANTSAAQGVTQESDDIGDRNEGKATKDMFPTLPTAWYGQEDSPVKFDLVDPSGKIVETKNDKGQPTFTVENVGTYTLDPVKGLASFTPVPSFTGPAPRVEIQTKGISGGEELKAAYNPFVYPVGVEIPSAFERADQVGSPVDVTPIYERTNEDGTRDELASVNPETIQIVADGLPDGSVIGEDKKSVTVPGEGSWTVDDAGKFTFTPLAPDPAKQVQGFTGNPTPISYLAKNVQDIEALVPGQVTALYPPIATDDAITTGDKGQTQLSTDTQDGVEDKGLTIAQMFPNLNPEWAKAGMELVDLQEQGSLNDDKTVLTVEGKGTYTLDKEAGTISFAPAEDFQGTAPKVGIKLTGVDTQPAAAYTPIVRPFTKNAVVVLPSKVQRGKTGEPVSLTPPLADNIDKSTIKILNADGNEVDSLEVEGGKWTVDKQTGEFTFTPNEGYLGSPTPVQYTAKDRFGTEAKEPGEVAVQYPNQRTVDSATSGKLDVNQTSRTFTGEDGMFPTLPAWESNTFALEGADDKGKIVRPGVGTFSIDNGRVVFDPEPDFQGKAEPVTVVAKTTTGETLRANYEPTVVGPKNEFVLPSEAVQKQTGETAGLQPVYASNVDKSTVGFVDAEGTPLADANGNPVKTLTVEKQGTWTIDDDGNFSFDPVEGFLGSPEPVRYTAKNTAGQLAKTPGTMIATYPKPRTADSATADQIDVNQNSRAFTGDNGMFPDLPAGWDVTYALDGAGKDGKIVRDGVGTFSIDNGRVVFDPEPGYVGKADPVTVVAKTATGETLKAKYEPVVIGTANEFVLPSEAVQKQTGETAKLTPIYASNVDKSTVGFVDAKGTPIVDGKPVKELTVEKQGTWTIDQDGNFSFKPVEGFLGSPEPVRYTAKNTAGQLAKTPGTMIATYPKQRTVDSATADNVDVNQTSRTFIGEGGMFPTLPQNWKVEYALEGAETDGPKKGRVVRPGKGEYYIDVENGAVIFDPEPGYVGKDEPVTVVAKTATGETLSAKYEPVVIGVKPPTTSTTTTPTDPTTPATTTPATSTGPTTPAATTPVTPTTPAATTPATSTDPTTPATPTSPVTSTTTTPATTTPATPTSPVTSTTTTPATPTSPVTSTTTTPATTTPETPTDPTTPATPTTTTPATPTDPTTPATPGTTTPATPTDPTDPTTPVTTTPATPTDPTTPVTTTPATPTDPTTPVTTTPATPTDPTTPATPATTPATPTDPTTTTTPATPVPAPQIPDTVKTAPVGETVKQTPRYADNIDRATVRFDNGETTKVVPGEGTWTVDETGEITFTPADGFVGNPAPVEFTAKDRDGRPAEPAEAYVVYTVAPPTAPKELPNSGKAGKTGEPVTQTPAYTTQINRSTVRILDNGEQVERLVVPGEGTWTVKDGEFTFTPADGFEGNPTPIMYTAKDRWGRAYTEPGQVNVIYPQIAQGPSLPNSVAQGPKGSQVTQTPAYGSDIDTASIRILDANNVEVTELVVPGEGTWLIDGGVFTFTPAEDLKGDPTPIRYTGSNTAGVKASQPGKVAVEYYAPKEIANELPNSGRAGEPGEAVVQTPGYPGNVDKQSVRILDGDTEVTELAVPGQGVWKVAGGTFTFTPERTFDGSPDPIRYTAKDTDGKQFVKPAEVTVTYPKATAASKPVVPASGEIAYAGEVVKQTPPYPANVDPATVRIIDPARGEVTELVVPGEGIWTVKDGEFTFTPEEGFTSNPTPVKYTAADKDGVKAANVAEVRVRYLAIDATKELPSSGAVGKQGEAVKQTPAYRSDVDRTTVRILDGEKEVTELTVPGEGTWSVDSNGEFTFTPEKDFFGTPNAIWYTAKANSGRSLVPGNVVVAYPMSVKSDPSVTPKPTDPTPTDPSATDPSATPTPTTPVTDAQGSSGSETVKRCVANAVRSPILWALPIGLLAAVGGPIVEPYVGQFQAQLNGINAELNRLWRENTKQDDRDWGIFGNGGNRRRNNDNEQFGELMRQVEAFNAQIQQVAGRPEVQELGKIAGAILGVVALSAVMYDWCTTDPGKAWTSIDFEGGSSIDSKRNATRYTGGKAAEVSAGLTTVKVTTKEEPTQK